MESLHDNGRVRLLGVSNFTLEQLQSLLREARVPPRFVQNRCYASQHWDRHVRALCGAHGMIYQAFSLLTANISVLTHPTLTRIAQRHSKTPQQIIFRFALDVGMLPLTGTTSIQHMRDDLATFDFRLAPNEVEQIENVAAH
jgi:diketogulonate reductase-like aldo/keto reductase